MGDPQNAKRVEVTYVRGGKAYRVQAAHCVLACYNMVIPYLCPEMPEKQKEALHYSVKLPLVYSNVQISNWESFQKLGVNSIYAPGGYFNVYVPGLPGFNRRKASFSQQTAKSPTCCTFCALHANRVCPRKNNIAQGVMN